MAESSLVHLVDDVPELDGEAADAPLVMIHALEGFLDAGSATERATKALIESSPVSKVIATFDVDDLHDYRARRPAMTFNNDHYENYDAPRLVVRLLKDAGDTPYLLLHGPEPDVRWEAFTRGVRDVVDRFGVTEVVSIASVPMAVPHTRPLHVTQHANDPSLLLATNVGGPHVRIPSHLQALVELRLGEWGYSASGFVAHVPHYLAQLDYPRAAVALLEKVERQGRLTIDLGELLTDAQKRDAEIVKYLEDHEEVAEVVAALERQYDTFARGADRPNLLAPDQKLPTGEELGREFEAFLAGLEDGDK